MGKWSKTLIEVARENPLYVWVLVFMGLAFIMLIWALIGSL